MVGPQDQKSLGHESESRHESGETTPGEYFLETSSISPEQNLTSLDHRSTGVGASLVQGVLPDDSSFVTSTDDLLQLEASASSPTSGTRTYLQVPVSWRHDGVLTSDDLQVALPMVSNRRSRDEGDLLPQGYDFTNRPADTDSLANHQGSAGTSSSFRMPIVIARDIEPRFGLCHRPEQYDAAVGHMGVWTLDAHHQIPSVNDPQHGLEHNIDVEYEPNDVGVTEYRQRGDVSVQQTPTQATRRQTRGSHAAPRRRRNRARQNVQSSSLWNRITACVPCHLSGAGREDDGSEEDPGNVDSITDELNGR